MNYDYSIDVAFCVTSKTSANSSNSLELKRLVCLDNGGLNYCCDKSGIQTLASSAKEKLCCSYEDYLNQQWVTLATIESFSVVLAVLFSIMIILIIFIFFTSSVVRESHMEKSRRNVLNHLLKNQIIHKSGTHLPSAISSLRHLSKSLSDSLKRKKKNQPQSKQPTHSPNRPKADERARFGVHMDRRKPAAETRHGRGGSALHGRGGSALHSRRPSSNHQENIRLPNMKRGTTVIRLGKTVRSPIEMPGRIRKSPSNNKLAHTSKQGSSPKRSRATPSSIGRK